MPDNRRHKGRTGAKIDLGFLYGGVEQDPNALEGVTDNQDLGNFGDVELQNEGTGESRDTIREPRINIQQQPTFPQYKKPGIWQNLVSGGQANRDFRSMQGQSSLAEAESLSHLRNSQLLAQQTNQYNVQLQDIMHKHNVDADTASQMLKHQLAMKEIPAKQNAEVFAQYGIPVDPFTAQITIDKLNSPDFVNSQIGAKQALGHKDMAENQLAEDNARLKQEQLQNNRPALLDIYGQQTKGNLDKEKFLNQPNVQQTMWQAEAAKQGFANRLSEAQANAFGSVNVGGNLVDRENGGLIFKAPNKMLETLQNLRQQNSGVNNTNQPRINIPGVTPANQPSTQASQPANMGQQSTEGWIKGPNGQWYRKKSAPTN